MSFKNFIQTSKEARKVFGRKEIEIMLKQMNGLALTQSEKNRLSRDIRPKLMFIKECAAFSRDFEMKKSSENKILIEKAVSVMLQDELKPNIAAIFLFGSHASGIATPRSDIDICVVFRKDLSLKEATKFRIRISQELPEKVDIQVFNILPLKLKRSIARSHKLLYKASDFDNLRFTIRYLKDEDYFLRMEHIFEGAEA